MVDVWLGCNLYASLELAPLVAFFLFWGFPLFPLTRQIYIYIYIYIMYIYIYCICIYIYVYIFAGVLIPAKYAWIQAKLAFASLNIFSAAAGREMATE